MVNDPEITEIVYNNFSIQERLKKVYKTRCLQYFKAVLFIYDILRRSTSKYASVDIQSSPAYLPNSHSTSVRNQKATFCIQGQAWQNAENHKRFSSNSGRNEWESTQCFNLLHFLLFKKMPSPAGLKQKLPDREQQMKSFITYYHFAEQGLTYLKNQIAAQRLSINSCDFHQLLRYYLDLSQTTDVQNSSIIIFFPVELKQGILHFVCLSFVFIVQSHSQYQKQLYLLIRTSMDNIQ